MLALTFQVGPDRVAVDVTRIREVVPRVRLAPVNGAPAWIAGVFIYRGRIVPVVDLHRLIGVGECPLHLSSRVILLPYPLDNPESLIGLLATQVADIRELPAELVQSTAVRSSRTGLGPALPDGAGILRLLNPDALLGQIAADSGGLIVAGGT
jgi:chemotaxis-related protein WspB